MSEIAAPAFCDQDDVVHITLEDVLLINTFIIPSISLSYEITQWTKQKTN